MYDAISYRPIFFSMGHRGIASSILLLSRWTSSVETVFTHTNVCDGISGNYSDYRNLLCLRRGDL